MDNKKEQKKRRPARRRKKVNLAEQRRKERERAERDLLRKNILDRIPDRLPDMYPAARSRKRRFILPIGPTNSGKTYEAIEALKKADALVLVTEWKEFRQPDFEEIVKLLNQPVVFDGRNQYERKRLERFGIEYHQIGVASDGGDT